MTTDDFYVGYLALPKSHRKLLLVLIPVLLVGVGFAAGAAAFSQRSPGKGVWLAQEERSWRGIVRGAPYPLLEVTEGEDAGMYLLVDSGKVGAQEAVAAAADHWATVTGTLLTRDGRRMIELSRGGQSIAVEPGDLAAALVMQPRGGVDLSGEVIDPKCFLGAMKPGDGKAHKACATLCIRGGIPPMLLTFDGLGRAQYYLLVSAEGSPLGERIVPFIGERVRVTGRVFEAGDLQVLRLDEGSPVR